MPDQPVVFVLEHDEATVGFIILVDGVGNCADCLINVEKRPLVLAREKRFVFLIPSVENSNFFKIGADVGLDEAPFVDYGCFS